MTDNQVPVLEVHSLVDFMRYCKSQPKFDGEVCISIASVSDGTVGFRPEPSQLTQLFDDVLILDFDDTMELSPQMIEDMKLHPLTRTMADKVVEFVMKNKSAKKIHLHCFAGISRSRSMAAAIAVGLPLPQTFTINNRLVYQEILRAFERYREKENS